MPGISVRNNLEYAGNFGSQLNQYEQGNFRERKGGETNRVEINTTEHVDLFTEVRFQRT
jgi:hypothetical protein